MCISMLPSFLAILHLFIAFHDVGVFGTIVCSDKNFDLPIPDSCESYRRCKDGVLSVEWCPNGTRFDSDMMQCSDNTTTPCRPKRRALKYLRQVPPMRLVYPGESVQPYKTPQGRMYPQVSQHLPQAVMGQRFQQGPVLRPQIQMPVSVRRQEVSGRDGLKNILTISFDGRTSYQFVVPGPLPPEAQGEGLRMWVAMNYRRFLSPGAVADVVPAPELQFHPRLWPPNQSPPELLPSAPNAPPTITARTTTTRRVPTKTTTRNQKQLPEVTNEMPKSCGKRPPNANKITFGRTVDIQNNPWQAGLMKKNSHELICGGSIISKFHIVSAAHCFVDNDKTQTVHAEELEILVGDQNSEGTKVNHHAWVGDAKLGLLGSTRHQPRLLWNKK